MAHLLQVLKQKSRKPQKISKQGLKRLAISDPSDDLTQDRTRQFGSMKEVA